MELASQECCLHSVLFTRRYVTFVLVIITFVFTLYNVVVLEKNRPLSTIFNSLVSTGDSGRQPPPSSAPPSGDQSRHSDS